MKTKINVANRPFADSVGKKVVKRILTGLLIAGASALSGCLSVHVHHDTEPAPVIVVPSDHPNP